MSRKQESEKEERESPKKTPKTPTKKPKRAKTIWQHVKTPDSLAESDFDENVSVGP